MKFINTLIDIVITAVCIGFVAGFAYIFHISNAAADINNLLPYLNNAPFGAFEIKGFTVAILGVAIGVQLLKATFGHDAETARFIAA